MRDLDELIDAYWRHYELANSRQRRERLDAEGSFWAWDLVEEFISGRAKQDLGIDRLDLVVRLTEQAPNSAEALAHIGAGPLDNYLVHSRLAPDITRVNGDAERNQRFRIALRCVWFDKHLDPEDAELLRRFGPPL